MTSVNISLGTTAANPPNNQGNAQSDSASALLLNATNVNDFAAARQVLADNPDQKDALLAKLSQTDAGAYYRLSNPANDNRTAPVSGGVQQTVAGGTEAPAAVLLAGNTKPATVSIDLGDPRPFDPINRTAEFFGMGTNVLRPLAQNYPARVAAQELKYNLEPDGRTLKLPNTAEGGKTFAAIQTKTTGPGAVNNLDRELRYLVAPKNASKEFTDAYEQAKKQQQPSRAAYEDFANKVQFSSALGEGMQSVNRSYLQRAINFNYGNSSAVGGSVNRGAGGNTTKPNSAPEQPTKNTAQTFPMAGVPAKKATGYTGPNIQPSSRNQAPVASVPVKLSSEQVKTVAAQYPSLASPIKNNASFASLVASDATVAKQLDRYAQMGGKFTFSDKSPIVVNHVQTEGANKRLEFNFGTGFRLVPSSRNPTTMSPDELNSLKLKLLGNISNVLDPKAIPSKASFAVRTDLKTHLTTGEGVTSGVINGSHNKKNFIENVSDKGGRLLGTRQGVHPAIKEYTYQLPKIDPATNKPKVTNGKIEYYPAEQKTVYRNDGQKGISDDDMTRYAMKAAGQALKGGSRQQDITVNTPNGPIVFRVYTDPNDLRANPARINKEISNVHPIVP